MLNTGTKLGPYEIVSPLGAGGMGEVYRARDTRLERSVAIKVLSSQVSADSDLKQRFEREARTISALQHPHICTLHDVGHQDGIDYLVMEYLEGETLADRLKRGPLALEQTVRIAVEVCDALEKAHRQGIVHRDLKPGNIMLTKAGAKLMDFGLAKSLSIAGMGSAESHLTPSTPTMNMSMLSSPAGPLTQRGMIVGTFQYMAPESLQGQPADARSDIFSLGCVLYEMITGRRAFEGKSQLSVLAAILDREPEPIRAAQPMTPPELERVVETCLAKDPDARWQSAGDVGRQLRWITNAPARTAAVPASGDKKQRAIAIALAAVMVVALAWLTYGYLNRPAARAVRASILPPENATFDFVGDFASPPALSPDGTHVIFGARREKEATALWIRSLETGVAEKLSGTEGGYSPFWSPDSRAIGFFSSDGKLKKIAASGGPAATLADAPNARGGTWNSNNLILFAPDYRSGIWKVSGSGGTASPVTTVDPAKHTTHRWPAFLPDGKHFLYFATHHSGGAREQNGVYLGSLDSKESKLVMASDSDAQYAAGNLIFHNQSVLMAQAFDPGSSTLSGDPVTIAEDVQYDTGTWRTSFSVSENGVLVYEPDPNKASNVTIGLTWMDRTGKVVGQVSEPDSYKAAVLSPDGKKLAVSVGDPKADIWVLDLQRNLRTRVTFDPATHLTAAWSPDGQKLAYSTQAGTFGASIHVKDANGGGEDELLISPPTPTGGVIAPQWSSDGRYMVYHQQEGPVGATTQAVDLKGDRKPFTVVKPEARQASVVHHRLSPDGKWLAYSSTDSGREEIYMTRFPSGSGRWQISRNGGTCPIWRGDGKELYYYGGNSTIEAVEINAVGVNLEVGESRSLFPARRIFPLGNPFDVSPDGKKFLLMMPPPGSQAPMTLVVNWTNALAKK
ncbi:MAG TPA: protein kinase [Terriglobales bacterium]|nr:protein kinase [Terriglobales bacterium]